MDQPGKKGMPNGHVMLSRLLVVPLVEGNKARSIAALANKREPYDEEDEKQVVTILGNTQILINRKLADQSLKESEKSYQNIIESAPILCLIHKDGIIDYVNEKGCTILGGKCASDLIGRNVFDFVHPEYRKRVEERYSHVQKGHANTPEDIGILRDDGGSAYLHVSSVPFHYRGGPAILIMAQDITDRKRTEDALRKSEEELKTQKNCSKRCSTRYPTGS